MSVVALDTTPTWEAFSHNCDDVSNVQPVAETSIVALPNGPSANDPQYNAGQPHYGAPEVANSISGAYSLVDSVSGVSHQLPGVEKSSEPIAQIELDEVSPAPAGGMTPMLSIGAIGEACETIRDMAANEPEHEPAPFIQTGPSMTPTISTPAMSMSGPA